MTHADLQEPISTATVGFDEHVRPLFRTRDRQSMRLTFDLWSYRDVSVNATSILQRLKSGAIACDGPWPQQHIDLLKRFAFTPSRHTSSIGMGTAR